MSRGQAPASAAVLTAADLTALAGELERAGGELAIWLAPGDELLPGGAETLAAALAARPAAVLAYPAFELVGEDGTVTETVPEELGFAEMLMFQHVPVGPGAIFRLEPARRALPAAPEAPGAELGFWLALAAQGQTCRLVETLARRPAAAAGGGDPRRRAIERLAVLDRVLAREPEASEAQLRSAARSACVLAAAEFEAGFNDPAERFHVADRFAAPDPGAELDADAEAAELEARIVNLEQRLARHQAVLPLLEGTVAAREERLAAGAGGRGRSLRGAARRLAGGGDGG